LIIRKSFAGLGFTISSFELILPRPPIPVTELNVKPVAVVVPPGVVIVILPVAPVPITALIVVELITVKEDAATAPKLTAVAPVKFVPVIVIVAPVAPLFGVKEVIVGGAINVNPEKDAVPPGLITLTFPDEPEPTTAFIVVEFTTVNDDAAVPPNVTAVAPVKFVPVIVTVAPGAAEAGVKDEMVGVGTNVNPARVAEPPNVVTVTFPEAPDATIAFIPEELLTVNEDAFAPPKLTAVTSLKFVPVMVTLVPFPPLVGVKDVMVGGTGITVNHARDAIPDGVTTLTLPEAPAATVAVMLVEEFTVNDVAATPPKLTAVVPVRLVPVIVTIVPDGPLIGVNDVIDGPV